eukprot:m.199485 g.199485  ORF g.199485 m.199485 type:complete len:619 (+) comp13697_c2_seq3:1436-3292(+)
MLGTPFFFSLFVLTMSSDQVTIRRALVSVFDKSGIDVLADVLKEFNVCVLSTGGTAKALREHGVDVVEVKDVTKWPEMLGGRVKSLHPAIHSGLLAKRDSDEHMKELKDHDIEPIDLVVSNLYPFEKTADLGKEFGDCIEMIDIGGPTMVRSAAKNCDSVAVVTSPSQYASVVEELRANSGALTKATRHQLAAQAFLSTASYDTAVSSYFSVNTEGVSPTVGRHYVEGGRLRYGANPHQKTAMYSGVHTNNSGALPFKVLNGQPGYINLMDALNAWQLVLELNAALGRPAAASFKHVSPAGAAVFKPLTKELEQAYEVDAKLLSETAIAYVRARGADPLSSYGDFVAISGIVDVSTAKVIKFAVSDGIIAEGYEEGALEILKQKKKGRYLILQGDKTFKPPPMEHKEVFGVCLTQQRNDCVITPDVVTSNVKTTTPLSAEAVEDLVVASITVKYTQSNSVCYALDGQVIGVGAGQQSRVDCVKLAGRKVDTWRLRTHPKVLNLKFKQGVKKQERINARVAFINDDMTEVERKHWLCLFDEEPQPLSVDERKEWLSSFTGVSLSSDAFFPFRDNIDQATKHGVSFIVQPGGSVQDDGVLAACEEYGIAMSFTALRLFHH